MSPPYTELNGQTITETSKDTLLQIIKEEIKNAVR